MSEIFRIYLAGGCANEADEGRGWREKAVEIFKQASDKTEYNVKVINPLDFFSYSKPCHQSDYQVKDYYLDQILHSRLVLVNLNGSNRSCGSAQELQFARDHGIQIIGFGETDVYNWMKIDCQATFPSLLQAIDYIIEKYLW